MAGFRFSNSQVQYAAPAGQIEWTATSGSFTWIVPNGVYGICAVCIGGGGGGAASSANTGFSGGGGGSLLWGNNIPVTPGEQLNIVVGASGARATVAGAGGNGGESYIARGATRLIAASAGQGGQIGNGVTTTQINGTYTAQSGATYGGGIGGSGITLATAPSSPRPTGGGGAGGYSGNGGNGAPDTTGVGSAGGTGGGGGGGSGGSTGNLAGGGGGGVYPYGQGSSGVGGVNWNSGTGGSSGKPTVTKAGYNNRALSGIWSTPENSLWGQHGGEFGGGGGAAAPSATPGFTSGDGCRGCVRILWGADRSFPSTNVDNYNGSTIGPSGQSNYITPGTQTFTVPANVTYVGVVCIGGGGAGGQGLAQTNSCASGSGGALIWGNFPVVPGENFTVVIGAGGTSTGTNTQTAGGPSHITRTVSFKGFMSGTSLFITEVISGIIFTGLFLSGPGISLTPIITAFVTGEYGKEGTYTISNTQTIGSLESPTTFTGAMEVMRAGGGGAAGAAAGTGTVNANIFLSGTTYGGGSGGGSTTGSTASTIRGGAGGGAGGYAGNGASALRTTASASASDGVYATPIGSGAPTSGSSGTTARAHGAGGGGVGIFGQGPDGGAAVRTSAILPALTAGGQGGSGGGDGVTNGSAGGGGAYGGGGGGQGNAWVSGRAFGGAGAVRFVWGKGRTYPQYVPDI